MNSTIRTKGNKKRNLQASRKAIYDHKLKLQRGVIDKSEIHAASLGTSLALISCPGCAGNMDSLDIAGFHTGDTYGVSEKMFKKSRCLPLSPQLPTGSLFLEVRRHRAQNAYNSSHVTPLSLAHLEEVHNDCGLFHAIPPCLTQVSGIS